MKITIKSEEIDGSSTSYVRTYPDRQEGLEALTASLKALGYPFLGLVDVDEDE